MSKINEMYDKACFGGYKGTRSEFIKSVRDGHIPDYHPAWYVWGKRAAEFTAVLVNCICIMFGIIVAFASHREFLMTYNFNDYFPWKQSLSLGVSLMIAIFLYSHVVHPYFFGKSK